MIEILDAHDPQIREFISIRDRVLHDQNLVVCETEKLFLQFIHSGNKPLKTLSTKEFALKYSLNLAHNFIASRELLSQIAGFKLEYEVLFLIERPCDYPLDQLDDRIILLNGLTSAENVGSICRSSAAFGVRSIITDEKCCSPFLRRCIRVSMGNVFALKTLHSQSVRSDLVKLKHLGYTILATANLPTSTLLGDYSFPKKCVLIIGSEGHGVDQDILMNSDDVLKINIDSQVAHLNAANAAAIFLSHLSLIK